MSKKKNWIAKVQDFVTRKRFEALCASCVNAGNLHKWAFVPRGCAVLWVHPDHQRNIFPVVTSVYDRTDFDSNFSYQGTNDNSQYYTAKTALKFHQDIGGHVSFCIPAPLAHLTLFTLKMLAYPYFLFCALSVACTPTSPWNWDKKLVSILWLVWISRTTRE